MPTYPLPLPSSSSSPAQQQQEQRLLVIYQVGPLSVLLVLTRGEGGAAAGPDTMRAIGVEVCLQACIFLYLAFIRE